ncbi:SMP-30/gluconolactonase/LRE family protein [Oxalobacteraceae bacterium R-40]|uniref:Regucalcin n=1 Tax=Keguizhuia sedimenti TaxID=3064264 RepID=A0ABU1BRB8_9BURK|nr:SMP-30/gluconolactonase/LRE family protein [Oxalobacteraceae bacterium R-40]
MDMVQNTAQCVWNAGATLGEGPVWSVREQALYWVDILSHCLHRYAPNAAQQKTTWQFEEEITSVAERSENGGLIITLRHRFAYFDPATEKLEPILGVESDLPGNRFNDGKCDPLGRLWAGTMDFGCKEPTGSLYRFGPDRALAQMDSGYPITNGPTWSADYKTMYYNDTFNGRMYAFDFDLERGELSNKRLFLQLGGEEGNPDGMTTDSEGGIWIAQWGASKVTRRDETGKILQTVTLPCSQITSCAFGGPELRTLYITTAAQGLTQEQLSQEPLAGGLFAVELKVAGLAANRFKG